MTTDYKVYRTDDLYKAVEELKPFENSRNQILQDQYYEVKYEVDRRVANKRYAYWEAKKALQETANELRHALNIPTVEPHGLDSKLPEEL